MGEQGKTFLDQMTVFAFSNAVLLGGMWAGDTV
jgi:hypothetical protein